MSFYNWILAVLLPLEINTCIRLQGEWFCLTKDLINIAVHAMIFRDKRNYLALTGDLEILLGFQKSYLKVMLLFKNTIAADFLKSIL